jgi:hypothetical protein
MIVGVRRSRGWHHQIKNGRKAEAPLQEVPQQKRIENTII